MCGGVGGLSFSLPPLTKWPGPGPQPGCAASSSLTGKQLRGWQEKGRWLGEGGVPSPPLPHHHMQTLLGEGLVRQGTEKRLM